ncbi:MAG: GDSL-type esterase/lipase family protein [Patescibacteria group bacterium]
MNKNNRTLLLGIILIGVAGYLSWSWLSGPDIRNLDSSGTTIVAFGDSLVQGVGSTAGRDIFSLLSDRIGQPIVNLGVSGDTTEAALSRLQSVLDEDPRLVIILLGGNDYLKRVPIDTTFENLGTIIQRIHESGAAVLLLGVRGGLLRDTYNERFEEFAEEHRVGFVPNVLDGLIGDSRYMSDAIHPNSAGYALIADKIEPVLKEMLDQR